MRRRKRITPTERIPMHHAEGIGGGSEAAVIEKPEGDFVIQTRDEEIPFDPEPKTDVHVHINLDLPKLVENIVDLVRGPERVARRIRRSVSNPIQADEQQQRIFTQPSRPREVFKPRDPKVEPPIPMGGLLQTENPALYVLRTGNNPVGKHDTPKSKHKDHDPRVGREEQQKDLVTGHRETWLASLPSEVRKVFEGDSSDHSNLEVMARLQVNADLLGEKGPLSDYPEYSEMTEQVGRALELATTKYAASLPQDVKVFRGVDKKRSSADFRNSYLYVTTDPEMAVKYAGKHGVVQEATVSAGSPVAYGWGDQNELILPQGTVLDWAKDASVEKHDTPNSPHREHGPKAKKTENLDSLVAQFVEVASAGPLDMHVELEKAWKKYPEEARHLKEDAIDALDRMFPGQDTVTVFHATWSDFVSEGSFDAGFDPFTSFSLSEEAARQIIEDFGISDPAILKVEVPKDDVATLYSSHPAFEQEGLPAEYQQEILFDKKVAMNGDVLKATGLAKHDTPKSPHCQHDPRSNCEEQEESRRQKTAEFASVFDKFTGDNGREIRDEAWEVDSKMAGKIRSLISYTWSGKRTSQATAKMAKAMLEGKTRGEMVQDRDSAREWEGARILLDLAEASSPKSNLYRGMFIPKMSAEEALEKFSPGVSLKFGLTSTTMDKEVAQDYAVSSRKGTGIILTLDKAKAFPVGPYYKYEREKEMVATGDFVVQKVVNRGGVIHVQLSAKEESSKAQKAPGIDESGPEPVTGYRLGSPPSAPPVSRGFKLANDVIRSQYRVEKDISGPGSPTDSSDVYTPAAGGSRKQKRPKAQDMLGVVGEELD